MKLNQAIEALSPYDRFVDVQTAVLCILSLPQARQRQIRKALRAMMAIGVSSDIAVEMVINTLKR